MKYILIVLLLVGCDDYGILPVRYKVDPRLETYMDSFYKEAHARGINPSHNVRVEIGEPSSKHAIGTTARRGLHITITIADWHYENMIREHRDTPQMFDAGMENLIFHEMGHAVLDREHCDPCYSIMSSEKSIFEYAWDEGFRTKLIDELFKS